MNQPTQSILMIRHHPILLLVRAWQPGLLLLISATLVLIFASAPTEIAPSWFWLTILGGLFLVGAVWLAAAYLSWNNDRLYLTATRLIEIAGISGLREERRELRIDQLQSVEIDFSNPIMRWCGCADLVISLTAIGPLRFAAARDPLVVRERILARLDEYAHQREQVDDATVHASIEALLEQEETPLLPQTEPQQRGSLQPGQRFQLPAPRPLFFGRQIAGVAWRRHPWFLCRAWVGPILVLIIAMTFPFLLDRIALPLTASTRNGLTLCLLVVGLFWLWWQWADWRNDHYVVTPDRLVEIEQMPLGLRQQFTEAALDKVQDIRYRIPNPLANLLNYGDVMVRTASTNQPFIFRGIARPRQLAAQIDHHVTALRLAEEQGRHQAIRSEFARWLTAYDELRNEIPLSTEQAPE